MLAPTLAVAVIPHLDAVNGHVYDPDCPSRRLSLGRRQSPRDARLDVAGPGRGRHAVGYWLPDGVCPADHAAMGSPSGCPDARHRPQRGGHGLSASWRLSLPPRGGTGRGGSGGRGGVRLAAAVCAAPRRLASLCRRCPRPPHDAALWGARGHGGCVVVSTLMGGDHCADGPGRSVSQPAARAPTLARRLTGRQIRKTLTGTTLVHASRTRCARLESRSTWHSSTFDLGEEGSRWSTPSLPGRGAGSARGCSNALAQSL